MLHAWMVRTQKRKKCLCTQGAEIEWRSKGGTGRGRRRHTKLFVLFSSMHIRFPFFCAFFTHTLLAFLALLAFLKERTVTSFPPTFVPLIITLPWPRRLRATQRNMIEDNTLTPSDTKHVHNLRFLARSLSTQSSSWARRRLERAPS